MKTEELISQIAEELKSGLKSFIGEMPSYDDLVSNIKNVLEPEIKVKSVTGGSDGVFKINLTMPPKHLARMVWLMYEDGCDHDYITNWLNETCPKFKDVLCEIITDTSKIWALKPSGYYLELDFEVE
jgi:hypothetical protein